MQGTFELRWIDEDGDVFLVKHIPWIEFKSRFIDQDKMQVTGLTPQFWALDPEDNNLIFWPTPRFLQRGSVRDTCR